ncbi:hypothetical protein SAMN05421766_103257 [Zobellia uliginosa]|uniref:YD repeat-containing protein n=1 Tax=Zobellia uliginosa TaxID=143224 RepID=A0ABY1KR04_9FLAO|nr:hypothetical protein [Zobellia uliginosa]SIS66935.1 hypothetical protein SAMN05421766_103257 [Zobellia uliginosa]
MIQKIATLFFALVICTNGFAQDIETFKVSDFNLKGNVKSCEVITDYGKEEYYFDKEGRLTKSITRYNDSDYETTYYKYVHDFLKERRVENYMDGKFDRATSIASFYEVDTLENRRLTEKIVSYDKELLEKNVYVYNAENRLVKIIRTNTLGIDETDFEYLQENETTIVNQSVNGRPSKTKTISKIREQGQELKKVEEQNYIEGLPTSKTTDIYDSNGRLTMHKEALYDASTETWIVQDEKHYQYGEDGVLSTVKTKKRFGDSTENYIYQFDGTTANNWVKEIVTPQNVYTTRRITYYQEPVEQPKTPD